MTDSRRQHEDPNANDAALDFVRFCHRRRRAGWPELYDEMCAVASRGLYHGWGFAELAEHGIAFGLSEMPRLAGFVAQVAGKGAELRTRPSVGVLAPATLPAESPADKPGDAALAPILLVAAG